ncbi:Putative amidase domain-containing protein [Halobacillus karajensis]|uniref:Amidase domain protein n=1 Tax=Halobacillus karajensis TaxID=195088 RepID=A0A024P7K4_9BACI|nr:amidase domain-containing protein [Halobacillus karajensis]CDQ21203.1 Putative amidase domain protein [Halobacillus karajensis]CDQ24733.1 Putative amidase domain protein [Halobacillus karajensis]CDQ28907.1 Putative amidase domain protein [Halobacillus karajensis]SEH94851.1 Putative amidase domain-containing protein [Halobacillus karajensis]
MSHTYKLQVYWEKVMDRLSEQEDELWLRQKVAGLEERGHQLQRMTFHIHPYHRIAYENQTTIHYLLHLSLLIKSGKMNFLEEGYYVGRAHFLGEDCIHHRVMTERWGKGQSSKPLPSDFIDKSERSLSRFTYNRREAVRYADRWWDSYNPQYKSFDVDCTNYVSQCLRAGGAPTWGAPNRTKGWWYGSGTWSYSWSVAHALRWYLGGARQGLTATEASTADQLSPGDVICYDFQGNGRFDHNTFVVKKDANGMPLVNAHTSNSRHRYWAYEDSTAYTPDIQYKFYKIDG